MLENKFLLSKVLQSYCRVNKFLLKEKQAYVVFYIGSRTISNIFYISHKQCKAEDSGPILQCLHLWAILVKRQHTLRLGPEYYRLLF